MTKSDLTAEVLAFSSCYDYAVTLAFDIGKMLGRRIDSSSLREAYASGDLKNVAHVSSEHNIADVLTKEIHRLIACNFFSR